ncbi:alpha-1,3-mannosyl-glycoprotein 2-beta-N-acetylglucosaminyltransferase [Citrus sinensis]|nr:alpha-1,3-mannosyl-glycoprotein 2-beta-N-acetylglucosaminyltransferase [Citrus sinensis]
MRLLIDQISMQQGRIVALEDEKKRRDEECGQLKALVKDLERRGLERLVDKVQVPVAAVVIMACNRANYLERTINSVFKYVLTFRYQGSVASKYPLFVSQDGSNPQVKSKALSYDKLTYMQHLDFEPVHVDNPGELTAYYKIAREDCSNSSTCIIACINFFTEMLSFLRSLQMGIGQSILQAQLQPDDMEIAPDFFDYFEAAADLLDKDKSIMAVSSWNDNGQKQFVHDPYVLYRSDFFPGLGWMLTRTTWDELSPKWPKAYPCCYFSLFFFSLGSSLGQFFQQYLAPIKLNDVPVDWKSRDLSYLIKDNYEKYFAEIVKKATPVHGENVVLKAHDIEGDVRIEYKDQSHFEIIARQFGIFNEWKDGIPRTAYKGVVVFRYQTPRRIFLVGPDSLRQLGIKDR